MDGQAETQMKFAAVFSVLWLCYLKPYLCLYYHCSRVKISIENGSCHEYVSADRPPAALMQALGAPLGWDYGLVLFGSEAAMNYCGSEFKQCFSNRLIA